jgi:PilZ domain
MCYDRYLSRAAGAQYHNLMKQTSPVPSPLFQEERLVQFSREAATVSTEDRGVRAFAKLTDISFGGCYVEMTATSAPGAAVHLAVEVSGIRFRVKGVVKTSDPCLGMGIAFTEISDLDQEYLQKLLLRLSGHVQDEPSVVALPANLRTADRNRSSRAIIRNAKLHHT